MKAFSSCDVSLLVETHLTKLTPDTALMFYSLTDKLVNVSRLASLSDAKLPQAVHAF